MSKRQSKYLFPFGKTGPYEYWPPDSHGGTKTELPKCLVLRCSYSIFSFDLCTADNRSRVPPLRTTDNINRLFDSSSLAHGLLETPQMVGYNL